MPLISFVEALRKLEQEDRELELRREEWVEMALADNESRRLQAHDAQQVRRDAMVKRRRRTAGNNDSRASP